jgi:hypothetical protein
MQNGRMNRLLALLGAVFRFLVVGTLALATLPAGAQGCNDDSSCLGKVDVYNGIVGFATIGADTPSPLPPAYRALLREYYPNVDLANIRTAFAPNMKLRQWNFTDCDKIYFIDPDLAGRVKNGALTAQSDIRVLVHELRHTEQCVEWGGRDLFAARWYDESFGNFGIHDNMPMEMDASARASSVIANFPAGLFPPVRLLGFSSIPGHSVKLNEEVLWSALAAGGTGGAVEYEFMARNPDTGRHPHTQQFSEMGIFKWLPHAVGPYDVTVTAREKGNSLIPTDSRTIRFFVTQKNPPPPVLLSDKPSPQKIGTEIEWSSGASTPVGIDFEFRIVRVSTQYDSLAAAYQPFGDTPTFKWKPTKAGTYQVTLRTHYRATADAGEGPSLAAVANFVVTNPRIAVRPASPAAGSVKPKPRPEPQPKPKPTPPTH